MFLFADSGSTKTEWMLVRGNGDVVAHKKTMGLNPYFVTTGDVSAAVNSVIPADVDPLEVQHVFFYGAGCGNSERRQMMVDSLENTFTVAIVDVYTDILGAARAVWQKERGIAIILGTGANACAYNGDNIFRKVMSLGYLLGDEGSGAYLGKKFLDTYYKSRFDHDFMRTIRNELDMDYNNVMNSLYRGSTPSVYLASFVPFIHKYREQAQLAVMLKDAFQDFFDNIVRMIPECCDLPVGFVGSIGYHFEKEIRTVAADNKILVGQFIQDPLEGIVKFHLSDEVALVY
ncbi:MAG: hypothetical protein KBB11_10620 [Bacteroidales bacterium]|nr:hypothetical protein [Bacteroidales bacterium]HOY39526.1 hypothetical protein [Bacteroidales bacterium]HQP04060.1 hypothetical protein [Bacteroidales bacterium]